ncbi:MAG TPA: DUF192 domain-containing protein [Candidatus Woesearchaeota archaeon]|nr:DUF192 domain-containing protein [Candidatus Woesearchaeota archaeon]
MKQFSSLLLFIPVLSILALPLLSCTTLKAEELSQACFSQHCFRVELALTPEERARGLMYRESLDENKGMLFIFENKGEITFWMKNTLIPLDIIWLDESQNVVYIIENAQPCISDSCETYTSPHEALYVLELNAGKAREIGLRVGDRVDFRLST